MKHYPVYRPRLGTRETENVLQCLQDGWISSRGAFVTRFESDFAAWCGAPHATSVCNGTVALHLALLALDLKPGGEVIVPTFTYVASVNAIAMAGLVPVFVDSLPDTWQVDPADVARKITPRTVAVMAVHLYGHPCDMDALQEICTTHDLPLIEDCAEAFGSTWKGRHVGTFGAVGTFSFFGNKTITTGEGGMLIFNDPALYARAAHLKNQAVSPRKRYWHEEIGYNYRMTNIAAALGCAQLETAADVIAKKRQLADWYREAFDGTGIEIHGAHGPVLHSYWMVSALLPRDVDRNAAMEAIEARGIESRPTFYPVHTMPMFADPAAPQDAFPVATDLGGRGLNLPSYPDLDHDDVRYIARIVSDVATDVGGATRAGRAAEPSFGTTG